jgi:hypothetical protein
VTIGLLFDLNMAVSGEPLNTRQDDSGLHRRDSLYFTVSPAALLSHQHEGTAIRLK